MMVYRMARPTKRNNSANAQFRQRVPLDLVETLRGRTFVATLPATLGVSETFEVQTKIGDTVVFSLRSDEPAIYKARHAAAQQQVNAFFEAARRGPEDLTFKQINGLCGALYKRLTAPHEDNPPSPVELEVMADLTERSERFIGLGTEEGRRRALDVLRSWVDIDAFMISTATSLGVALSQRSQVDFIEAMPTTLAEAIQMLNKRRAADYGPDSTQARYAPLSPPVRQAAAIVKGGVVTFDDLFDRWKNSGPHAPATLTRWRSILRRFKDFVGHDDPSRVTDADASRWKDDLLAAGLKKIDMSFIAALRRLYGYSVDNAATTGISVNPFAKVKADQKEVAGTGRLPFSTEEVATILTASRNETAAYKRWIPWLQASSGARVAELTQLWGSMVTTVDGVPCIRITPSPDGGRLKNAMSERTIPIHPTIVADGFLDFVKARGSGPLFYGGTKARAASPTSDEQKHPSKGVSNRLAAWVRGLGIDDPRKAPNHAWRRWVKTELGRAGCSDRLADAIQGHAAQSEGDKYYHGTVEDMLAAISKLDLEAAAEGKRSRAASAPV
ncbi:tyrosine-type recombinase/integrase [Rhizobium wuzhouense]|nr:tyrosine-type recombinase/integrase [Rhizobium wuzhouense]